MQAVQEPSKNCGVLLEQPRTSAVPPYFQMGALISGQVSAQICGVRAALRGSVETHSDARFSLSTSPQPGPQGALSSLWVWVPQEICLGPYWRLAPADSKGQGRGSLDPARETERGTVSGDDPEGWGDPGGCKQLGPLKERHRDRGTDIGCRGETEVVGEPQDQL